jgi:hypothetical protein
VTVELERRRTVLRDDLEPVPLGNIQLLNHGLMDRITDLAQVLVGTARKQIDVDQWHGPYPSSMS